MNLGAPLSENRHLLRWVEKMAELTKPAAVHWVDGSQQEYDRLCEEMIKSGTFIKLNQSLWPGCYYARSDASDVARVKAALSFARFPETMRVPQTIGRTRLRCAVS